MNTLETKQERYNILVSRILTNKAVVGKGLWDIGLALKEIKERELYLLEFRDFKEFLSKKVDLSERTARRCIEITSEFDLREFMKWGLSKLEIIKREFPEETEVERKKFISQTSGNVAIRQLPEEISRFKSQVGIQVNKEEAELQLIRQYTKIEGFLGNLIESLTNWIAQAKKHSENEEIRGLLIKANELSRKLK